KEILSIVDNQDFIPVVLGSQRKTIDEVLREAQVQVDDSTYYHVSEFINPLITSDLKTVVAGKEGVYYPVDFEIDAEQKQDIIKKVNTIINEVPQYDVSYSGSLFHNENLVNELIVVL